MHSFGPLLLGKVLDLNETQTSILALVFKYCDDNDLPLLDLKDLATTLKFLSSDEGKPILAEYGGMSAASVGVLLRSIVVIEQEGADVFFGEPEFDVDDLLRTTPEGEGIISILELSDVMDKPRLFSTFMLWMLAQLYESLPEAGDLPKPKLCFFFDEAHLLFDDASEALMDQVERTARLIRSKGVGIYFVTQAPTDVPSSVLAQLGNRVQHALRAFTPDDADALRKTARTFPMTDFYAVETTITSLGTGEALVTVLSPKGVPTPLAATRLLAPDSLMAPIDEVQFRGRIAMSPFQAKYGTTVDRDSAHERITTRIAAAREAAIAATQEAAMRAGVDPTTAAGMNSMTPAQLEREMKRQQKELEAAQARAAREAERQRKAEEKAAVAAREAAPEVDRHARSGPAARSSRRGSGRTSCAASSGRCSAAGNRAEPEPSHRPPYLDRRRLAGGRDRVGHGSAARHRPHGHGRGHPAARHAVVDRPAPADRRRPVLVQGVRARSRARGSAAGGDAAARDAARAPADRRGPRPGLAAVRGRRGNPPPDARRRSGRPGPRGLGTDPRRIRRGPAVAGGRARRAARRRRARQPSRGRVRDPGEPAGTRRRLGSRARGGPRGNRCRARTTARAGAGGRGAGR